MRAIEIAEPGGPEVLRLTERPTPDPGPGEVRIEVRAAGVNRPDCLQRRGVYPPPPGASDLPGLEVAGVVDAVGRGVFEWREGDRVSALVSGGGYAEHCIAPAGQCLPVPPGRGWAEAAVIPEALFTVWANVFEAGRLSAGEWLLVHGGTSGIGTMAIALARAAGARVAVTCGTADKCDFARRLGADLAIDYVRQDFVEVVRTEGAIEGGVDVVLDTVGGDYVTRNLAALRPRGRHVSIAFQRGAKAELDITTVMRKQLVLTGSTLRPRPPREKRRLRDAAAARFGSLLADPGFGGPVSHRFPLREAAEAHRVMEAGAHRGKIALELGP